MDKGNKMPMWRKVTIAIITLMIITCLIILGNLNKIITNEESSKYSLLEVMENDDILNPLLSFDELSEEAKRKFTLDNKTKLKKFRSPMDYKYACQVLYDNKKFINVFGRDKFEATVSEYGDDAYNYRCETLRNKVVKDAFDYLYSPYTANGKRDNSKGMGLDWEEYNQMSIPAKEDYIRSDIQHKYSVIVEKEDNQRKFWERILYLIILTAGLCVFCLISHKIGRNNRHAKNLAIYTNICMALSFLIYSALAINDPNLDETLAFVLFDFLPSVLVISLIERFLAKKSYQDYHSCYLIPKWLSSNLQITNEFRKRLLMIILIYPFFLIVPLPVVGLFFLAFYILPVLTILAIIWIVLWIREGKKMDAKPQYQNDRARLYCRHCGKLIDADSEYCRYCGKKL